MKSLDNFIADEVVENDRDIKHQIPGAYHLN